MPRQVKGLDHHLWVPKINMAFLAFSHANDNNLILSSNLWTSVTTLLNSLLLCSFHNTQVQSNQINWRNELLALPTSVIKVNCVKWSEMLLEFAPTNPIHWRTCFHNGAKEVQDKNKWSVVSTWPHPDTQRVASVWIIPRAAKFALVGRRSRISRQAKIETFKGTCRCQTKSKTLST